MTNPSSEWRWADPTGQQRLVREDELRAALAAGVIPSNAPVWRPGWKQWKTASDVAELKPSNNGDVPAPPMFIVAAQNQFEGRPLVTEEPPPPPRYVPSPSPSATQPRAPAPPPSGPTLVDPKPEAKRQPPAAPQASRTTARGPAPAPAPAAASPAGAKKTAPLPAVVSKPAAQKPATSPPPLPKKSKSTTPPPLPAAARKSTAPPPLPAARKSSVPPPLPARARSAPPPPPASSGRHTLPVAPAPPPLPRIDPVYAAPPEPEPAAAPVPQSKFPTLMMFGEDPQPPPAPKPEEEEAPPIVVPPPEPSNVTNTNAVTRPPPWGDGAVGIADNIPKAPSAPMFPPPSPVVVEERISDAPRPMELSSSDLTSEARMAAVKPAPLVAAERPRTMMGMGAVDVVRRPPPATFDERTEIDRPKIPPADPTEPTPPPEHMADTTSPHVQPPFAPASGAKIHDLREIARKGLSEAGVVARKGVTEASSLAKRAYSEARERTKDKPPWFLPAIGGGALVVLIGLMGLMALVVHAVSGGSSSSAASASAGSGSPRTTSADTGGTKTPPAHAAPRPVVCALSGSPRTVAPKALVPSGVEVTPMGSQIALGFATAPKEGVLELLDPASIASASSLHLRAADPIRRVLAYAEGKPQAALDADRKSDALQGRRTLRATPPIDVGAMDGGLVWAPHNTDKGIKLWPLAGEAPIQALRGEPLADGKGFAVAFRQGAAIFVGAFGGSPPGPLGPLLRADGLGPQVGSPAIAASDDRVMVAWADRAGASDPWGLRYAVMRVGDDAIHPQSFALPPGGLGEQGMSPGLSPLPAGAFLLLWTEGQVSDHQVRGAVFEGGKARDAFTASAEGVNAGQPQGAVLPDGRGVVAFLASTGKSFEVVATPIQCTEK